MARPVFYESSIVGETMMRSVFVVIAISTLALLSQTVQSAEQLPPDTKLTQLIASPSQIELAHRFDDAQLLITGVTSNGEKLDVTRMVQRELSAAIIDINDHGLIRAKQNGTAELKLTLGDQSLTLPIKVSGVDAEYHADFIRDVNPVLSKLGCNQGTCHGGAQGKNGFKLSLRGYDPLYDYRALTDDLMGRRFNRVMPDQSLMLLKPSGAVPHVGGVLCKPGETGYDMLRAWIAQGLPFTMKTPRVTKIDIEPRDPVIPLAKLKQQFRVMATYADGKTSDVTAEAFIESGNIEVLEADRAGLVTALRRGESSVLVRYEGNYAATTVTVMGDRRGFTWNNPPAFNYIDEWSMKNSKKSVFCPAICAATMSFCGGFIWT